MGRGREWCKDYFRKLQRFRTFADMETAKKILRRLHRDRDDFTAAEVSYASQIIAAYNEEMALRGKNSKLPTKEVAIGDEVEVSGRKFVCVKAARVNVPSEACSGCALRKLYLGCGDLKCSPFDRRDGNFVWFKTPEK